LQISKKQNRELQYASAFRASRVENTFVLCCLDNRNYSFKIEGACEGLAIAATGNQSPMGRNA
jgi:hypothetical protein